MLMMKRNRNVLDLLRESLQQSELSRYEIAKRSGIDQGALSRFIHGGTLRVESVEKLCPVLGLQLTLTPAVEPGSVRKRKPSPTGQETKQRRARKS
jgi:transcriptional regulator with XRE-family HTH domain